MVITSWLVRLDWQVMFFRPYQQWPEIHAFLDYYVVLGQRGPTAVMVAAWLGWRSWRQHTLRPLLTLGASLLLLNITVGAAKLRHGPARTALRDHRSARTRCALGGDIFPSRPHRQRGGDLGNPGLSGLHPAGPPLAVRRLRGDLARRRRSPPSTSARTG